MTVGRSGANGRKEIDRRPETGVVIRAGSVKAHPMHWEETMDHDATEPTHANPARRTEYVSEADWRVFAEFKAGIAGRKGEALVRRELARIGSTALHDVIMPCDGGVTQIDHLVLAGDAIAVVETKAYGGYIAGSPEQQSWTQHLGEGEWRYALRNPLHQNARHCRAVAGVVAGLGVDVRGYVVFVGMATFSEALEGQVHGLADVGRLLQGESAGDVPEPARRAWQRLVDVAAESEPRRGEHQPQVGLPTASEKGE